VTRNDTTGPIIASPQLLAGRQQQRKEHSCKHFMKNQSTSGNSATSPPEPRARDDAFLTSKELATVLKISIRTIRRWQREGLPTHRRKRVLRFPLTQIREWMKVTRRL